MTWPEELLTPRLWLRRWRAADREPLAALNADPRVMEHFPALLSPSESDAAYQRMVAHFDRHGFGLWAVEVVGVAPFAGFVGLCIPRFEAAFTPCVEIGWRLAAEHWGQGFATEGAQAALAFGFDVLQLREIVSFTVPANRRSRRVMEKLGMTHNEKDDFDHPLLPQAHPLCRHVLYRIARARISASAECVGYNDPPTSLGICLPSISGLEFPGYGFSSTTGAQGAESNVPGQRCDESAGRVRGPR